MRRIRIDVQYDGTAYFGWQVQPGLQTIQGELQRVLSQLAGAPVIVHGSGRTDAGVHAMGQVAAFDFPNPMPSENLLRATNRLLPADIRVVRVEEAIAGFHPRHHASAKTYRYRIHRQHICPPFERLYVWNYPYELDELAMMNCAGVFEGQCNFRAFAASDDRYTPETDFVRRVFSSTLRRDESLLTYEVRGSGFLKHMVRNLIGALVEVGRGNLHRGDLLQMLETGIRHRGVRTLPPSGLFLVSVEYPDSILLPPQSGQENNLDE